MARAEATDSRAPPGQGRGGGGPRTDRVDRRLGQGEVPWVGRLEREARTLLACGASACQVEVRVWRDDRRWVVVVRAVVGSCSSWSPTGSSRATRWATDLAETCPSPMAAWRASRSR